MRYFKNAQVNFSYGHGLKGEISLGEYTAVRSSDKLLELHSLVNGKDFLLDFNDEMESISWSEEINFQSKYWHSVKVSSFKYEDVDLALAQPYDETLEYYQRRMVSLHKRRSEWELSNVENVLQEARSPDLMTAHELLQANIFTPFVDFVAGESLSAAAGTVLFSAGDLPENTSQNFENVEEKVNDVKSVTAVTPTIRGCPFQLHVSCDLKLRFSIPKTQLTLHFAVF